MTLKEMHDEALQLFYDAKYMRSLSVANRLYGKAESLGERVYLIDSLILVALDLYVLQDYEYSLSEYLELIDILENDKPDEVGDEAVNNARYGAALCYQNLGNLDLSFQYFTKVIDSTQDSEYKVKAYLMLCETLRSNYEIQKDERYLKKLYSYLDSAFESITEDDQLSNLYNLKGRVLGTEGKIAEALESYFKSNSLTDVDRYIASNLNEIAYCYIMLDQDELALEYLDKTWDKLSILPFSNDREKARYYYLYGLYYMKKNNYDEAIESFNKSEELYAGHKVCLKLATTYYELGRIYEKLNQLKKAGEYYCKYELYKEKVKKLGGKL